MMTIEEVMLTEEETEQLIKMFLYGRHPDAATAEEIQAVLSWAGHVRMQQGMLDGVLQGSMIPSLDDKGEVQFRLTPQGLAAAEELVKQSMAAHNRVEGG